VVRVALVLLCGCNAVFGLDETTGVAGDAREPCAAGAPFGAGVEVAVMGTDSIEAARFNRLRSLAYLSLCANEDKTRCDLYTAPLTDTGGFGGASKLTGISVNDFYDAYPSITPDGEHLLFASTRDGQVHVYVATASNGSFDQPTIRRLSLIANEYASNEPYILGDGKTLYFSGATNGASNADLYRASGSPPGFGGNNSAVRLPGMVNGTAHDLAPVVTDDELEIFFASGATNGGLDIQHSVRFARSDDFAAPARMAALSTGGNDWPVWISPDRCELYYINKPQALATLYVARR
jgi:Tol biopolymer transport system component